MKTLTVKEPTKQEESIKHLRSILKPGTTVYHALKHVSSSGMSRQISFFIVSKDKRIQCIDWHLSHATGYKRADNGAIKVSGCGMDMGFAVVYNLGRKLYPKGFKLGKNQYGRNGDRSGFDTDGGYSLKSEWI